MYYILKGNYLDVPNIQNPVTIFFEATLCDSIDKKCLIAVDEEENLPFKCVWKPFTLRGYGELFKPPLNFTYNINKMIEKCYKFVPENGSLLFY